MKTRNPTLVYLYICQYYTILYYTIFQLFQLYFILYFILYFPILHPAGPDDACTNSQIIIIIIRLAACLSAPHTAGGGADEHTEMALL